MAAPGFKLSDKESVIDSRFVIQYIKREENLGKTASFAFFHRN